MNLKKLLTVATLFVAGALGFNANAQYTADDLTSSGWTEVSELPKSNAELSKNYYVFYATEANLMLAEEKGSFTGDGQEGQLTGVYRTPADPKENNKFAWILEYREGNFYGIRNLSNPNLLVQTRENATWRVQAAWERIQSIWTQWDIIEEDTENNKFVIKNELPANKGGNSSIYIGPWMEDAQRFTDNNVVAGNKSNANAGRFKIYSISRLTYDNISYNYEAATKENPLDVTGLIPNASFDYTAAWWDRTGSWGNNQSSDVKTFESWNSNNYTIKQTLSDIPNGLYKLTVDVISGNDVYNAYVYAEGESLVNGDKVTAKSSADDYGTMSNEVAGKTLTANNIHVTNKTLNVGVKDPSTGNGWIVMDNFKLYYYGPTIESDAVALPNDGKMEAGKWYYVDIEANAEYNIGATAVGDIVYATDGTTLIEDAGSISACFVDGVNELLKGRYYVKSSSANQLVITVAVDSYTLDESTRTTNITDGSYIKNLTSFVVTYPNAATTDADAKLAIISAQNASASLTKGETVIATGTLTSDNASKALTATFADVTLDLNSTYTITIPAGVFGYEGEATNEEVSVNFNTPVIADGYYYMYNTETESYLSRSGIYATSAILDNWGLAVYLLTDGEGKTTIQYFDSKRYVGGNEFCWADFTDPNRFIVTKVDGGYKFLNTSNNKYFAAFLRDNIFYSVGDAVEGGNLYGKSNVWVLETLTDHHANNYTKNANAQAATAATNAGLKGLSEITTVSALESYLEGLGKENITITGADAEKYQVYAAAEETLNEADYYTETVNGLKPGLYKLSVDAFQRASWNEDVAEADGARSLIYVYANDAKTQIKSVMEYGVNTAYTEGWNPNYEYEGKNYPNSHGSAKIALATGEYRNDVYVYVADGGDGTGSLTFGINNPTRLGNGLNRGTWAVYNNFTLTYYATAANMTITEAGWATFIAPFDVEIPEGVTAYTVAGVKTDNYLNKAAIETGVIPANTPVLLEGAAMTETFYGQSTATQDTYGDVLVGNVSGVTKNVPNNGESFVLLKQDGNLGFYKVATDDITVGNNRCYLNVPAGGEIKAFFFDDDATGINGVDTAGATVVERYNAAGMKVAAPVKGLNIVKLSNGKVQKVLVK